MSLLAAAWFWHTWASPTTRTVGAGNDSYPGLWFIAWFPYAVSHGLDPLITHALNAPVGLNLMWTPVMPLLGALVSPITVIAGPAVSYNVLATAAPALAGWTGYLAFRRWTPPLPAIVGALIFAFSPFMAAESADHVFLTFSLTAPLMLIVLDRLLVRQTGPAWRDGLWLGLLLWAQLLISEEVLAVELIVAAVAVATVALLNARSVRDKLEHALRGAGVAAVVAGVLGFWPLVVQFFGPQRPTTAPFSSTVFSADLGSFISPSWVTALHTHASSNFDAHFTANWTEWGSYLGLPAIACLIGFAIMARRRKVTWVATAIIASSALVSLGPYLHVAGHVTPVFLPWKLVAGIPLFQDLLPARANGIMFLGVGLLFALGLDELRQRATTLRAGGYGIILLSLATLAPAMAYYSNQLPTSAAIGAGRACPQQKGA
ncbi:MAG: hypothetical protein J2P57_04030, partial [Acidimicrobiaceae bacterium]|nr:hypothetical protein [Acidimicrobiaceae bacterium]